MSVCVPLGFFSEFIKITAIYKHIICTTPFENKTILS